MMERSWSGTTTPSRPNAHDRASVHSLKFFRSSLRRSPDDPLAPREAHERLSYGANLQSFDESIWIPPLITWALPSPRLPADHGTDARSAPRASPGLESRGCRHQRIDIVAENWRARV